MEKDTIILVDASPLFSPHSVAPSNYGVDFDSLENMGIDAEEGSGSKPIIPTPRRRYKWTVKRIVKFVAICKSLFVSQCLTQFLKITHQEGYVTDFALTEDDDPRYFTLFHHILFMRSNFFQLLSIDIRHFVHCNEILCDMHGVYITRDEFSLLNGGRWLNSVVCVKCFYLIHRV